MRRSLCRTGARNRSLWDERYSSRREHPSQEAGGYFETMEIPLIEGRAISDTDRDGRPAAAVVSESFARRFWPDSSALGRRLQFPLPGSPYDRQWFTVVGIVADAKYRELRGNRPRPLHQRSAQCPYPVHQFVVRVSGRPDAIINAVRSEVRAIDPALPIDDVVVLRDAVQSQMANPRLIAFTFNGLAVTASALAALGLGTLIAWRIGGQILIFALGQGCDPGRAKIKI